MDWGTVPDRLQVAGVLVAVAAYLASRHTAARDHASKVYVLPFPNLVGSAGGTRAPVTEVRIINSGQLPIFDVSLSCWQWGWRRSTWRLRSHTDWMTGDRITGRLYGVITPGIETEPSELPGLESPKQHYRSITPPVVVAFRDGNGRRWVRWHDGRLSRLAPSRDQFHDWIRERRGRS